MTVLPRVARHCIMGMLLVGAVASAGAAISYQVSVNTSSLENVAGNLNFQFNPGGNDSQGATAEISGFSTTGGGLAGVPSTLGSVAGTLPGTVTLTNGAFLNDYYHGFTFGTSFQFVLT
ncbi:MAG: NF038129 family PEP-CTERM protein [Bryobacteraceae bacterium]|nr:NF038129 family PEP-CTERM protein [Bryobacteraceae bacterium]